MSKIQITLTVSQYVDLTDALQARCEEALSAIAVTNPDDVVADRKRIANAVDLLTTVCAGHVEIHGKSLYNEDIFINGRWSNQCVYELENDGQAKRKLKRALTDERSMARQPRAEEIRIVRDDGFVVQQEIV